MTGSFCHKCEGAVDAVIEIHPDDPVRYGMACECHQTEVVGVEVSEAVGEMDIPDKWELWSPFGLETAAN